MIEILAPAVAASLVLLGIHSYFGIRIIRRNIIFTDLAIGQAAALGAAASFFFFDGNFQYPLSLVFALGAGAFILAVIRRSRHPEALIGLMYALGISGVFILLSKSPHGMEEFQNLMAYDILFTRPGDIGAAAALYAALGAAIFFAERKADPGTMEWIFMAAFAVTVTSSVRIAGVLVVFAILLAPSFIALQAASRRGRSDRWTLVAAWGVGTVINVVSITLSYWADLPTGYTVVFINALCASALAFAGKESAP